MYVVPALIGISATKGITCLLACILEGLGFDQNDWIRHQTCRPKYNKGGWVVDQQFMEQMGSAFLLAHGLGHPVADAQATLTFPETGEYRYRVTLVPS